MRILTSFWVYFKSSGTSRLDYHYSWTAILRNTGTNEHHFVNTRGGLPLLLLLFIMYHHHEFYSMLTFMFNC